MVTHLVVTFVDSRKASFAKVTDYDVRFQLIILRSSAG